MMLKEISFDNVELEYSILCCAFWGKEPAIKMVSMLEDADFTNPINRMIFQAIDELIRIGNKIDLTTVTARLNKSGQLTEQVKKSLIGISGYLSTGALIDQYINDILEIRYRRQTAKFAKELHRAAKEESNIDKLRDTLSNMPILGKEEHELTMGEMLQGAVNRIAERYNNPKSSIPGNETGFDCIDKIVGGIKDGELILLTAEPNVGKSLLAMQICISNAMASRHAVYFNYEMNEQQIGDRALAMALPLEINKIKFPKQHLCCEDLRKMQNSTIQKQLAEYMHTYTRVGRTLADIKAKCTQLAVRGKAPRLIVVDYLQLMNGAGQTEREKLEALSKGIKDIAREFNCPVVIISSLSKDGTTRGSKQIDYDADQMWHLSREHKHESEITRAITALSINKNRDGGKGIINLLFSEKFLRFGPADRGN